MPADHENTGRRTDDSAVALPTTETPEGRVYTYRNPDGRVIGLLYRNGSLVTVELTARRPPSAA